MMEAGTMMETMTTIDANFLLADMVMMMEAGTVMGTATMINATFLLADMVVMMMETTMTMTDANSRVYCKE
jgi:hypothetical protein